MYSIERSYGRTPRSTPRWRKLFSVDGGSQGGEMAKGKDKHTDLGLKEEDLLEMYRVMLLARFCDERQWALNRQGKAPFVVPVSGHEAAQVGSIWAFERHKDVFCPYYRDMALVLAAGFT